MNLHFRSRSSQPATAGSVIARPRHRVESAFIVGRCRFTLDCSCGAHHDTPFIDEALSWREQHLQQA